VDKAFKLKKPVRFPYLDFSTNREAACRAELHLNRRPAPEAPWIGRYLWRKIARNPRDSDEAGRFWISINFRLTLGSYRD
jgi:hypothetical protein